MTNEELVEKIQAGIDVEKNMATLYEQNKKFIYKIVKPYSKSIEIEDLMQEAYIGLHQAALKSNVKSEYKFTSYMKFYVLRSASTYSKKNGRTKRLPVNVIKRISKYYKFIKEYKEINNKKPTEDEIIKYLEITKKQFELLKRYMIEEHAISLQIGIDDEIILENVVADEHMVEEEVCEDIWKKQLKKELWKEVDKLPEKMTLILKSMYLEKKSLRRFAEENNMPKSTVIYTHMKALQILKEKENLKALANEYYNTSLAYNGNFTAFKNNCESVIETLVIRKINKEQGILKRIESIRNENRTTYCRNKKKKG